MKADPPHQAAVPPTSTAPGSTLVLRVVQMTAPAPAGHQRSNLLNNSGSLRRPNGSLQPQNGSPQPQNGTRPINRNRLAMFVKSIRLRCISRNSRARRNISRKNRARRNTSRKNRARRNMIKGFVPLYMRWGLGCRLRGRASVA